MELVSFWQGDQAGYFAGSGTVGFPGCLDAWQPWENPSLQTKISLLGLRALAACCSVCPCACRASSPPLALSYCSTLLTPWVDAFFVSFPSTLLPESPTVSPRPQSPGSRRDLGNKAEVFGGCWPGCVPSGHRTWSFHNDGNKSDSKLNWQPLQTAQMRLCWGEEESGGKGAPR